MLSKKAIHAVNALVFIASLPAGESVTTAELASQIGLSVSYVESLLKILREGGFIRSTRGPGGGYDLAMSASRISVWSVVAVVDPHPQPLRVNGPDQIDLEAALGVAFDAQFEAVLSATFIADHVQAVPDLQRSSKPQNWSFGIKPMAPRWMPEAPNSVFQLSQFVAEPAVAWHA
jgi:Rrf2 family iron-sulfur cluster assembly transcriptional regulator